ncbi:MAG: cupin domain-containing protein [Halobacteriota archaeon]
MPEIRSLDDLEATPHARPFDAGEPSVIRLALDAGESVDPHTHPDHEIVLYLRSGAVELDLDDETHSLEAGDVVRFDGRREVSPSAVEDSEALIVLARRAETDGGT